MYCLYRKIGAGHEKSVFLVSLAGEPLIYAPFCFSLVVDLHLATLRPGCGPVLTWGPLLLTLPCSSCLRLSAHVNVVFSVPLSAHRAQQEKNLLEGDSIDVGCKKVGGKLLLNVIFPLLSLLSVDIKHGVSFS